MKASCESDILKSCLQLLAARRVFAWRQNQGAIPLKAGGYRRFVGLRGVPDILAALPMDVFPAAGGHKTRVGVLCGIECKTLTGKQTKEQKYFQDTLEAFGGVYWLVRGADELNRKLDEWEGI